MKDVMVKGRYRLGLRFYEETADLGGVSIDQTVARATYALLFEVALNSMWNPYE